MADLESCYFCGTVDASLAEHDVSPPGGERRTATLCASCHRKLQTVLNAYAGGAPERESAGIGSATDDASGGSPDGDDPMSGITIERLAGDDADDGGAGGDADQPPEEADAGSREDGTPSDGAGVADDGEGETDDGTGETGDGEGVADDVEGVADDGDDAETAPDSEPESDVGDVETDEHDPVPDDYYKVMRLLENREFPMPRERLEVLITGAYQLSDPEAERVLEAAFDRGVLVERDGEVHLGRDA